MSNTGPVIVTYFRNLQNFISFVGTDFLDYCYLTMYGFTRKELVKMASSNSEKNLNTPHILAQEIETLINNFVTNFQVTRSREQLPDIYTKMDKLFKYLSCIGAYQPGNAEDISCNPDRCCKMIALNSRNTNRKRQKLCGFLETPECDKTDAQSDNDYLNILKLVPKLVALCNMMIQLYYLPKRNVKKISNGTRNNRVSNIPNISMNISRNQGELLGQMADTSITLDQIANREIFLMEAVHKFYRALSKRMRQNCNSCKRYGRNRMNKTINNNHLSISNSL